ncbi:MAG TPA: FUSC family protein [Candidatus Flavonifractor intestinipullorum]|uniref:FUSC family protein n=1 Tax=Candidatus Flavonifractor intestinipullorum TaxID=2838587 RepID=A0A9D2MAN1_9FIRM|nr:FUSC family protein [Candidatus Flavonifractor intestinipullorum]
MKQRNIPHIGMRIIKTAVAVMLAYGIFLPFGLMYDTETYHGVLGQMGPLYACIACIVCMQSTLGQTVQSGVSRLIGVAIGGVLGVATLLLGDRLDNGLLVLPILGVLCVAGMWISLLIQRPAACVMACIVPCVILITGVTGADRYYYAAARIIETVIGVCVAMLVNKLLPDHREEYEAPPPPQKEENRRED